MNPQALIDRCERSAAQPVPQPHDISNAIAAADHAATLAGLPTYTDLAAYLEKMTEIADPRTPENVKDLKCAVTLICRIPS